jgi:hypothetical protein
MNVYKSSCKVTAILIGFNQHEFSRHNLEKYCEGSNFVKILSLGNELFSEDRVAGRQAGRRTDGRTEGQT